MNKWLSSLLKFVFMASLAGSAQALVIDPSTGAAGSGFWDEGPGDYIAYDFFGGPDTTLFITLSGASTLDIIVDDCCIAGDMFGVEIDGVLFSWTSEGFIAGLYHAVLDDLMLSAGSHTIRLLVTADCCGSGGMSWFVSEATAVPAPAGLAILSAGLFGLGGLRRRLRQQ
ncbi:MAG: hypothetical protein HYV16_12610 [Gammaproteobacteria bacterium]|nr:hypothetical protein [Gammaproteobacteria bacterium]